jgi:hypothetical protein
MLPQKCKRGKAIKKKINVRHKKMSSETAIHIQLNKRNKLFLMQMKMEEM